VRFADRAGAIRRPAQDIARARAGRRPRPAAVALQHLGPFVFRPHALGLAAACGSDETRAEMAACSVALGGDSFPDKAALGLVNERNADMLRPECGLLLSS
jgi:hypothetical protein